MYDKRTETKWVHANGQAMKGPLAGRQLDFLNSRTITWGEWKTMYPKTQVLAREGREGFMGRFVADMRPEQLGISTGQGPRSTLFPMSTILKRGVINDRVNRRPITVTIDPETHNFSVFNREIDNQTLTFEAVDDDKRPLMRDRETGTTWHRISGEALDGPLKGETLRSELAVPWKIDRWQQIYRQGSIYKP